MQCAGRSQAKRPTAQNDMVFSSGRPCDDQVAFVQDLIVSDTHLRDAIATTGFPTIFGLDRVLICRCT